MSDSPYTRTLNAVIEQSKRRGRGVQLVSPAEVCLLAHLDEIGLEPEQQVPIGPYDLDFYFRNGNLCVEVDGSQHQNRVPLDTRRDRYLRERGIDTLRLPARVIYFCAEECAFFIELIIANIGAGEPFSVEKAAPVLAFLERLREKRISEWEWKRLMTWAS